MTNESLIPEDQIHVEPYTKNQHKFISVNEKADQLLADFLKVKRDEQIQLDEIEEDIFESRICEYHKDKRHQVIVMQDHGDNLDLLMFTSKPNWNPNSRRTAPDEEALFFMKSKSSRSYLAPIKGSHEFLEPTSVVVPEGIFSRLKEEFESKYLSEQEVERYLKNWEKSDRKPAPIKQKRFGFKK